MEKTVDFVLPWVDGNNPVWRSSYNKYAGIEGDSAEIRFRDWNLLRYWFRGIEKYAPWFRKIFFVTSGELPEWLNTEHPRLRWIKHEDYIPGKYLPTFNVNTIELNLHRIADLSEHFVYFNDDTFILGEVEETRFFRNGLPCDYGVMTAKPASGGIIHMAINDLEVIGKHFDKHTVMKKNFSKWFSLKYGKRIFNNILLYPWKDFSGFVDSHLPNAFLKSAFTRIWDMESQMLDQTSLSKFRTNDDVNQWLIKYWQLAEGDFYPLNTAKNTFVSDINDSTYQKISEFIRSREYNMICLNDSLDISDFIKCRDTIKKSFEDILPEKSSFEK